jgi:lipopolysaccharide biosynthesis regulator YciM
MRGPVVRTIDKIRQKLQRREYEITIPHFYEEMAADELIFEDIQRAIATGRIRRKFTRDPRGTRYEVVGQSQDGRHVAVLCRFKANGKLLLMTTYVVE